jgi:hypothetical protein
VKDVSAQVTFEVPVDLDTLAFQFQTMDHEVSTRFVLNVDEAVGDFQWTVELRDKLNEVIRKCDEAAGGNPTEDFLRWLVRMDDPNDEQGCEDRRTVTLSAIMQRARQCLGEAS